MKVRVLKNFDGYRQGQVFEWGDGMARVLISRGMIEAVKEDVIERAVADGEAEKAVLAPQFKKRQK